MRGSPLTQLVRVVVCALACAAGCGDDAPATPDSGTAPSYRLEVLDPPGEAIGLPFGGDVMLRVRYTDQNGNGLTGQELTFTLLATASEAIGGSILSQTTAQTDELGIARLNLTAGAEAVNFRTEVSAPFAPSALFYVAVSEIGFAQINISAEHDGFRDPASFDSIQVRLYPTAELTCSDFDVDNTPASVFPPRSLANFESTANYQNIRAGQGYTVVAWAVVEPDGIRLAMGCVDLTSSQVRAAQTLQFTIVVADRALATPNSITLESTIDLIQVATDLALVDANDHWTVIDCPRGRAQLLIDCLMDARTGSPTIDCKLPGSDSFAQAVTAERGTIDVNGCRGDSKVGGGDSLDKTIDSMMAGGPWPSGMALTEMLDTRREVLAGIVLGSVVDVHSDSSLAHRLTTARIDVANGSYELDLTTTARPVLARDQVMISRTGLGVLVSDHDFTLRLGSIMFGAFRVLGLAPASLDSRASDLGTALVDSVDDGTDTGCGALSTAVCAAGGGSANCLLVDCAQVATALDSNLMAWAQNLNGAGVDLSLQGSGNLIDSDDDLIADGFGINDTGAPAGLWTATFTTASGDTIEAPGTFGSVASPQ